MKFEHKLVISKFGRSGRIKENKEIYNKYYKDKFSSISEFIYCYLHQDTFEKDSVCPVCGNKINFDNKNCKYPKHCSRRCTQLDKEVQEKYKQTCLKKYGRVWYTQTKEYGNKSKQTCLSKYGKEYYTQTQDCKDKSKQTCLDKYGVKHYNKSQEYRDNVVNIQNKMKRTCLDKYGVDCYSKTVEGKAKIKQTFIKKYGVDWNSKIQECKDKRKQTCLKKYGETTNLKTKDTKDKIKQTCLEKYGVEHYSKTKEYQIRIYNTKKQNNTFSTSEPEEKVYKLLLTKFTKDDIERQYKSELYPFNCDFYIKSLDLYIEFNGTWTHGKDTHGNIYGSFNKYNPEHIKLLEFWRKKAKELNFKGERKNYFNTAIYIWTDLDVRKLETFKKNKLNYKIFWNIKEVEDWLVKLKAVKDSNGDYVLAVKSVK